MTMSHNGDDTTADNTSYADFGNAVTRLQESMDGLSEDMTGLEAATRKLETSTRDLSEKQREISEEMARTADEIRSANRSTARIDGSPTPAAADD